MSIELIALGILSGVFVAGAGYLKSVGKTNQDPFDKIKFLKTTVLGGIVGGVVPYTGLTADVVMIVLVNAGVVTLVENLLKTIFRKSETVRNLYFKINVLA